MNYKAKKSALAAVSLPCLLFCWLIIPLIVMLVRMLRNACFTIEFYDDRVIQRRGILNRTETSCVFTGVLSVTVHRSLWGRLFGFGHVRVDVPGKWDIDTKDIKNPAGLKTYLESKLADPTALTFFGGH